MINAAIVGLGRWGQRLVSAVQGTSDQIRFTAAVTRTPAKVEHFAAEHRLALHADYDRLLAAPAIDAIVLATPHSQHAAQVAAAAAAGKAVFVEKPFTLDKRSALDAVEACRRAGVALAFGHNRRFLPAMAALKERVAENGLGKLLQIEGNFSTNSGFRYDASSWRASRKEAPAGGMTGLGIHVVDAMIHLCGPIRQVTALSRRQALAIEVDDSTAILLEFESGMLGYLGTVTATAPCWRLQLFGTQGSAEMRGQDILVVTSREGAAHETVFPATDIERAELEAFARSVARRASYPVSAAEAIHGVAVLEAIARSAETGRPADVP